jgi:Protein of unknown function (DUF3455)
MMKSHALIAMILVLIAIFVTGCATTKAETIPIVPENLGIPDSEVLSLKANAIGVQIYECNVSKDDPTRFEWKFKAPEADLFDSAGNKIGRHYSGPTWELDDGSKVVGELKARSNSPDASAIPWLLLNVKSTSGTGILSQTKSVQRLNTVGGTAPTEVCSQTQIGKVVRVSYEATYYFYVAKP